MSREKGRRESGMPKARVGKQDGVSRETGSPVESGGRDVSRDNHKGQGASASVVGGCSLPWPAAKAEDLL